MKAEAIIFDKDGTLIDFDAFWVPVSVKAVGDVLRRFDMEAAYVSEIMERFGVCDGTTDINSVLCKGTYEQMGQIVHEVLRGHGCTSSCSEVTAEMIGAYNAHCGEGEVKPTCENLAAVLGSLRSRGIRLAVVTTDNEQITRKCLQALGIEGLFERIYTDDGIMPAKPDPSCALDFCRICGASQERTWMVGDTMTDIRFAKNAGITAIGLAKHDANRAILAPHADAVISDISQLCGMLDA